MDRPMQLDRIRQPNRGIFTIGSSDPESLERLSLDLFARILAQDAQSFVCGMHLGGGGGGADWQITYTTAESPGMGFAGTSVWVGDARISVALATDATELDRVVAQLLEQIATGAITTAPVYDIQIAGGGRDGAYLVVVLWGTATQPPPYKREFASPEQGPYTSETALLTVPLNLPSTASVDNQIEYLILWGAILNETSGTDGINFRLQETEGAGSPGPWTTTAETTHSAPSTEWRSQGGARHVLQSVDPALLLSSFLRLTVEPNGTSEVSARNAYLYAIRVGDNGEVS
jgi:hypothetical protein